MRLFRDSLTILALLVVIALIALMSVPHFVDWNQHSQAVAATLSRLIGIETRVTGALRINIFPQTEIEATGIEIGPEASPAAKLGFTRLTIAPTALLRGRVQVSLAELREVIVNLDGAAALATSYAANKTSASARSGSQSPPNLGIDRLEMKAVSLMRGGAAVVFSDPVDVVLEAPDIIGPYRLVLQDFAHARDFRAQIGRWESNGQARLKGVVEDAGFGMRMVLDGQVALPDATGLPLFDGSAQFNGNPLLPIREGGQQVAFDGVARLLVEPSQIVADPINIHLGGGENAPSLEGRAFVDLTPKRPHVQLSIGTKRFDTAIVLPEQPNDREKREKLSPVAVLAELERNLATLDPGFDATLELSIASLLLPAGAVQDVAMRGVIAPGNNRVEAVSMALPGQTNVTFKRGDAALASAMLDGVLTLKSASPAAFLAFAKGGTDEITGLPPDMAITTQLRSHKDGLAFSEFVLTSAAGRLTGRGEVQAALPGQRTLPHLALALDAAQMDARLLGAFAAPPSGAEGSPPFTLSMQAKIAALLLDGAAIGGMDLSFEQEANGTARLNRFRLAGRAGEELILSGLFAAQETRLTGKLDADKLDDIARLLSALAPGAGSDALMRRADVLAPARAVVQLGIEPQGANGTAWAIALDGKLGGTVVTIKNRTSFLPSGLGVMLDAVLDNPDGGRLLAQISGASGLPTLREGGRITLKAEGDPRRVVTTEINAALAGIKADFSGTLVPFRLPFMLEGRTKFTSSDLSILHQVLGDGVPTSPKDTVMTGEARLLGERWKVTLTSLNAQIGSTQVGGEIAFDFARAGQVAGQIKLKEIALYRLLAPAFGVETPLEPIDPPNKPLSPPLPPLLTGDLWIESEKASLTPGLDMGATQFVLRFAPSEIAFEGFETEYGPARYSGVLSLTRKGAEVSAIGRVNALRMPIPGLAQGRMSGEIPFTATGSTHQAFLASLAGAGQATFEGVNVPQADPMALARLLSQPPQALGALDENNIGARIVTELRKGNIAVPPLTLPLTMVAGQIRLGNTPLDASFFPNVWPLLTPSVLVDVPRGLFDAKLGMRLKTIPNGWRGALPEINLNWSGKLRDIANTPVQRQVQVASLVNGLLAGAIQRDLERAEAFEADVRERAFFLRRQKADAFMLRRAEEIAAFLKAASESADQPDQPEKADAPALPPPGGNSP